MVIETDSYGEIEYEPGDLIAFPDGLFGFTDLKQYLLLSFSGADSSVLLMLSVERPEIIFAVVNPLIFCPDYSPDLSDAELSFLEVKDAGELSYYTICAINSTTNYLLNTVNLKCPLAINPTKRIGMQVILSGSSYGYRHKFGSFPAVIQAAGLSVEEWKDADTKT